MNTEYEKADEAMEFFLWSVPASSPGHFWVVYPDDWNDADLTGFEKIRIGSLQRVKNRLRTIVQTRPECIKVTDHSGIALEMNPAGMEMLEAC